MTEKDGWRRTPAGDNRKRGDGSIKRWFLRRWAAKRTDAHAVLAARRNRVSTLREQILADLPFRHLAAFGLAASPRRDESTIVARKDRYGFLVRLALCHQTGIFYLADRLTPEGYDTFYRRGWYRQLTALFRGELDPGEDLVKRQHAQAVGNAEAVARALAGRISLPKGGAILDVGGSTGALAKKLADTYGMRATVVDPALEELRLADQAGVRTKCGLIEEMEFGEGESFDLIVVNQAIEHLVDLGGAFARLHGLLKPDGILIFDILDFLYVVDMVGCAEAASRLDHCQFLYDEMVDVFCARLGFAIRQRLFHKSGCILYVCAKATPDQHAAMPAERLQQIRRELLTRDAAWKKIWLLAPITAEERLVRGIAKLARKALGAISGRRQ